jgi:hypothetical protein
MSGSNTLLTLGALVLLSALTLTANRSILTSYSDVVKTQATMAAVSQAQSLMEEISSKAFDEALVGQSASSGSKFKGGPPKTPPGWSKGKKPKDFTPPGLLKKEANELYPDDVDDYNGVDQTVAHPVAGQVNIKVNVAYVNPEQTDEVSQFTQTPAKKVEMRVFTKGMQDTLKIVRVFRQ